MKSFIIKSRSKFYEKLDQSYIISVTQECYSHEAIRKLIYFHPQPENCLSSYDPHGFLVIYSSADRGSFLIAERVLQTLWTSENIAQKAVILVGNKADLARSRSVSSEGKLCHFMFFTLIVKFRGFKTLPKLNFKSNSKQNSQTWPTSKLSHSGKHRKLFAACERERTSLIFAYHFLPSPKWFYLMLRDNKIYDCLIL